jgi:hypothetical protein
VLSGAGAGVLSGTEIDGEGRDSKLGVLGLGAVSRVVGGAEEEGEALGDSGGITLGLGAGVWGEVLGVGVDSRVDGEGAEDCAAEGLGFGDEL